MRIAVHAQVLTAPKLFGIGYYLYNLLTAIGRMDQCHEFCLFSGHPLNYIPSGNAIAPVPKIGRIPNTCFSYFGFPQMARKTKCDLAFLPKEVTPFGLSIPSVITAYDLYSLKMPKEFKRQFPRSSRVHYAFAKALHFKRAAKILAISQDTKNDLIDLCNVPEERIVVTPLGADAAFFERVDPSQTLQKFEITSPFFLNTSSYWWGRKNLVRLIQAFARVKRKLSLPHHLVVTGKPGPSLVDMQETIHKEGLADDVKLLSYVEKEELVALMQSAEALVFPSLHEGFGLPILEAMAAGCPVVTSNGSAMKEVAADGAVLVDPLDVDSIAAGMETVATNASLRAQLVEKGAHRAKMYTWDRTAEITLEAFREL